jgi:2-methylisocitrate lyase-like PEP mutase family enzyme
MDVVFPEGLTSRDELAEFARAVDAPSLYNRGGISPNLSLKELDGVKVVIVANAVGGMRAAAMAVSDYFRDLAREDAALEERLKVEKKSHPAFDTHQFVGFPAIRKLEEEFLPREEVLRRYEGSLGFKP